MSNFGEINNIFNYCYNELRWNELIKLSNELLDIKKNHQTNMKNENLQYSVILIAIFTLCSQLMIYYADIAIIFILVDFISFIIITYLILKEKIDYHMYLLKIILKLIYKKIF